MTATADFATRLEGRGFVLLTGLDAATLLDNTISNSLGKLKSSGDTIHAGLLTPQGKILYAFFVVRLEDGFLLDTDATSVAGLIQRLTMYKLRAKVEIADVTPDWSVAVASTADGLGATDRFLSCTGDPRSIALGVRAYARSGNGPDGSATALDAYRDMRVAAGIADAITDYPLGETFTHEANWDEIGSVDFTKGCFIGQEVVSRTRHKTVVRKRICSVSSSTPIPSAAALCVGEREIGKVATRSSDLKSALAMIRIDRAVVAGDDGVALLADGAEVVVDPQRITSYRAAVAKQTAEANAAS